METWTDGIAYKEGDHACLKPTREAGRITVTVGGVGYVLMDGTNESELFAAYSGVTIIFRENPTLRPVKGLVMSAP